MASGNDGSTLVKGLRVVARGGRQERAVFTAAVVGSAVYGVGTAGSGFLLGRLTDRYLAPAFGAGSIAGADLTRVGLLLVGVALITAGGVVVRRGAAGMTMYRLQARYRRAVTGQYLRLPLVWHQRHPAGQLLSMANADVEAMWQVMSPLPMALGVIVMVAVAAVAMLMADPVLGLLGLVVLPGVVLLNALYQRRMSPAVMRAQQLRADVSGVAHESFEAAAVVKSLGREAAETARFATEALRLRDANVAVGRLRAAFDPAMEALPTIGILLVLVVGTLRARTGAADTGDLVQVTYLLTLVSFPLRATGWVLGELPRTVVGWERIRVVLEADGELPRGKAAVAGTGPVTLAADDVDFAHHEADGTPVPVLHGVTVDIPAGRTVAVVGATGSGKSTLAGLLVRLVDPAGGTITADGVDLRDLRAGGVAEVASLVPQQTFIFDDTVRGNVLLAEDERAEDDDRVWEALTAARADGFVRALPQGLDTRVGERGASLSGGQRQRIALARALVRRPRLLLLDDATSAIDPRVEAQILRGLRGTTTTVLVIAYRRATIALADEVVFVQDGRVADRGPHAELVARNAAYRDLVNAYDRPDDGTRDGGTDDPDARVQEGVLR